MYVKLFSSLYQGTLRGRTNEILVFTNLLAHADANGVVDKHWKAIAEETGLSKEDVEQAINNLEAPDPESRSPEADGCRITRLDEHRAWGWHVVNYGKYRAIRSEEDRREQNRLAQERWRNTHSNKSKQSKPPSAQAEAISNKQKEEEKKVAPPALPDWLPKDVWQDFMEHRKAKRARMTARASTLILRELERMRAAGDDPTAVLEQSIANGWTGIFALKNNGATNGTGIPAARKLSTSDEAERRFRLAAERSVDEH